MIEPHVVLTPAVCVFGERYRFDVHAGTHQFLEHAGISRNVQHLCIHRGNDHPYRAIDLFIKNAKFVFNWLNPTLDSFNTNSMVASTNAGDFYGNKKVFCYFSYFATFYNLFSRLQSHDEVYGVFNCKYGFISFNESIFISSTWTSGWLRYEQVTIWSATT